MAALTKDIDTPVRNGEQYTRPVAASTKCFAGGIAVINATGYSQPGTAATGLKVDGRYEDQVDNSAGADGDVTAEVRKGVFRFDNDTTNPVLITHVGTSAYIVDDHTVSSDATGTSAAGTIVDVDASGVWVEIA